MKRSRIALLVASCAIVVLLLGGGLALGVGPEEGTHRQVVLFAEVLSLVLDNYVDPVNPDSLLRGAYEGMLGGLDAEGAYLTPAQVADWKREVSPSAVGPGVTVLKSGGLLQIVSVAAGSPAEAAGLIPGDQIRRVDEHALRDLSLDQARRLLTGEPGSTVRLSVLRPREGFRRDEITVTRAPRKDPSWSLETDHGIAVLSPHDMTRLPDPALVTALKEARQKGVQKLLIDLRSVADGTPRDSARVAGLFTGGEVLVLRDRTGKALETVSAGQDQGVWPGQIGLLVNGATAGGGEALAAVLRNRRGASVYGESSYGLAAEPHLFELADGSGLLVPTSVWETAAGTRWNDDGLKPDTQVALVGPGKEEQAQQLQRVLDLFGKQQTAETASRKAA